MKTRTITSTLILFTAAAFAAEPAAPAANSSSASATVSGGKATITIDVNGKKETREIEIGNGTEVKAGTPPKLNIAASSIRNVKTTARTIWLGVAAEEVSEELCAQLPLDPGAGLIVRSVIPDSPAAAVNLQKNDVLMKLDDQILTNPQQLRTLVSSKKEGDTVRLTYFRRGQLSTVDVKLASHEETVAGGGIPLLSHLPNLGRLFQLDSKAVVVDKDGKVIESKNVEHETVERIAKALREAGVDQKDIDDATRVLNETTRAIRDAVRDATVAKEEALKGSSEIAKALEQVRDAVEQVRKQTEEAVRKDRESRRDQKTASPSPTPLEKQP